MDRFEKKVGFFKGLGVGSVAGVGAFTATLPLDFVKQYIQSGHGYREIARIVQREGVGKLWRGMAVGGGVVAPQMAIKFGVYNGLGGGVGAGFVAGCVDGAFLGVPLGIQAVQQMDTRVSMRQGFKKVIREGSVRFMTPLALRNGFYTTFMLGGIYPVRRSLFGNGVQSEDGGIGEYLFQTFIASSLLNVGGCVTSSPWDVIRARQIDNLVNGAERAKGGGTKVRDVVRQIIHEEGVRGFYRGFGNYLVTFGLRFPLTVVISELLKNIYDK